MTENKLFQLRTIWTDDNKKLNINIQKQGVSDQEALGILDMAKDQILNAMRERTVAEYSNK
jgi:hypothetical protein